MIERRLPQVSYIKITVLLPQPMSFQTASLRERFIADVTIVQLVDLKIIRPREGSVANVASVGLFIGTFTLVFLQISSLEKGFVAQVTAMRLIFLHKTRLWE
jgi:hypothetical protein